MILWDLCQSLGEFEQNQKRKVLLSDISTHQRIKVRKKFSFSIFAKVNSVKIHGEKAMTISRLVKS